MSKADKEFLDLILKDKKLRLELLHEQHKIAIAVYNAKREMLLTGIDNLEKHLKG